MTRTRYHTWYRLLTTISVMTLCGLLWHANLVLAPGGSAVVVPLGTGRELDINLWPVVDGMHVVFWLQNIPAGTQQRWRCFRSRCGLMALTLTAMLILNRIRL